MCWKGLVIAPRYYSKSEACISFLQARKGGVGRRKEGSKEGKRGMERKKAVHGEEKRM